MSTPTAVTAPHDTTPDRSHEDISTAAAELFQVSVLLDIAIEKAEVVSENVALEHGEDILYQLEHARHVISDQLDDLESAHSEVTTKEPIQ